MDLQRQRGQPFDSEQIAIVFGPRFVLTFQERPGDIFDPVRKHLAEGSRPMHEIGAPFLGYSLIDTVVDSYFPILDGYGELTDTLEQTVIENPDPRYITDIHLLKRELLNIRRALRHELRDHIALQHARVEMDVRVLLLAQGLARHGFRSPPEGVNACP